MAAWQARGGAGRRWVWAACTASALAFLVTVAFNSPPTAPHTRHDSYGTLREEFEDPWVAWNAVRAGLLTVSLGLLVKATGRAGAEPTAD